jgi:hypothetical protein
VEGEGGGVKDSIGFLVIYKEIKVEKKIFPIDWEKRK